MPLILNDSHFNRRYGSLNEAASSFKTKLAEFIKPLSAKNQQFVRNVLNALYKELGVETYYQEGSQTRKSVSGSTKEFSWVVRSKEPYTYKDTPNVYKAKEKVRSQFHVEDKSFTDRISNGDENEPVSIGFDVNYKSKQEIIRFFVYIPSGDSEGVLPVASPFMRYDKQKDTYYLSNEKTSVSYSRSGSYPGFSGSDLTDYANMPRFYSTKKPPLKVRDAAWIALVDEFNAETTMYGASSVLDRNGISTRSYCAMD